MGRLTPIVDPAEHQRCLFGAAVDDMDDDDRAVIAAALDAGFPRRHIARELLAQGVTGMSARTIEDHFRGACSCRRLDDLQGRR